MGQGIDLTNAGLRSLAAAKQRAELARQLTRVASEAVSARQPQMAAQLITKKLSLTQEAGVLAAQGAHAVAVGRHLQVAEGLRARAQQLRAGSRIPGLPPSSSQSRAAQAAIMLQQAEQHERLAARLAQAPQRLPALPSPQLGYRLGARLTERQARLATSGGRRGLAGIDSISGAPLAAIYGGGALGQAFAAIEEGDGGNLRNALLVLDENFKNVGGALMGLGANPSPPPPPAVKLDEAALKLLPSAEQKEWKKIAKAGGAVPCPLAPQQGHCSPQTMTEADRAWVAAQQAKRAAGNPGPPPPVGSSPERVAAWQAQAAKFQAANRTICRRPGIGLSKAEVCKTAADWAIYDGRPRVSIGIQGAGGRKPAGGAGGGGAAAAGGGAAEGGDSYIGIPSSGGGPTPPTDPATKDDGGAELPADGSAESSSSMWPWLIGGLAVAGAGVAYVVLK